MSGGQSIDLGKLNLAQLTQFKNTLDQELQFYQESLQNLKAVQGKFQESGESLELCSPDSQGKEILVPLTGSMYVPGKLSDPEKVMVDIGTGYYVEKDVKTAKDYFTRKVKYLTEQMEKVQKIGSEKNRIREAVMDIMEMKLQAQMAQQRQQMAAAGVAGPSS